LARGRDRDWPIIPPGRSAISCLGNRQHAPLKLPDRIRRSLARNKGEGGVPVATIPHFATGAMSRMKLKLSLP
jgi:hypothetical protein